MARLLAIALAVLALSTGPGAVALAAPPAAAPRIVAKPSSVMVNRMTKLTGTHFSASKSITIGECNATYWIVPSDPCSANSFTVTTNAKGAFKAAFTVQSCPGSPATGTSETYYIGEAMPEGIDTVRLLGAVTVTVTFP
jgi:hypothetical protein